MTGPWSGAFGDAAAGGGGGGSGAAVGFWGSTGCAPSPFFIKSSRSNSPIPFIPCGFGCAPVGFGVAVGAGAAAAAAGPGIFGLIAFSFIIGASGDIFDHPAEESADFKFAGAGAGGAGGIADFAGIFEVATGFVMEDRFTEKPCPDCGAIFGKGTDGGAGGFGAVVTDVFVETGCGATISWIIFGPVAEISSCGNGTGAYATFNSSRSILNTFPSSDFAISAATCEGI